MKFNGWTTKKGKTVEIETMDGEKRSLVFYPIRVLRLLSLQEMIKGVWKAMTAIGNARSGEYAYKITRRSLEGGVEESVHDPVMREPIDVMLERERGIEKAVELLLHPDNAKMVGELIMSSLREVDFDGVSPEEFLDDVDLDVFRQLITGFISANEKVLPGFMRAELKKALRRWEENLQAEEEETPEDTDAPSLRLSKADDSSNSSSERPSESELEEAAPSEQ